MGDSGEFVLAKQKLDYVHDHPLTAFGSTCSLFLFYTHLNNILKNINTCWLHLSSSSLIISAGGCQAACSGS